MCQAFDTLSARSNRHFFFFNNNKFEEVPAVPKTYISDTHSNRLLELIGY